MAFSVSVAGAIVIALLTWLVGRAIEWGIRTRTSQGTVRVLYIDPDDASYNLVDRRPVGGEYEETKLGDGVSRRFILTAQGRFVGEAPLYLVNPRTGRSYHLPPRTETEMGSDMLLKLSVVTPEVYHLAAAQRTEAPALNADKEDPNKWAWVKPLTIGFTVTILGIALVVLILAFRKAGGGA